MKATFISLAHNSFAEKKDGVETGKQIEYSKLNIATPDGEMSSVKVHKLMDKEKVEKFKMGSDVVLTFIIHHDEIRILDVNKA